MSDLTLTPLDVPMGAVTRDGESPLMNSAFEAWTTRSGSVIVFSLLHAQDEPCVIVLITAPAFSPGGIPPLQLR